MSNDGKAWEEHRFAPEDKNTVYVMMLVGAEQKVGGPRPSADEYLKALGWTPPGPSERCKRMEEAIRSICSEAVEEILEAPDNRFLCVWCGDCGETRDEIKHTDMCLIPKLAALAQPAGEGEPKPQGWELSVAAALDGKRWFHCKVCNKAVAILPPTTGRAVEGRYTFICCGHVMDEVSAIAQPAGSEKPKVDIGVWIDQDT
jgi:hypothetical protein